MTPECEEIVAACKAANETWCECYNAPLLSFSHSFWWVPYLIGILAIFNGNYMRQSGEVSLKVAGWGILVGGIILLGISPFLGYLP